MGPERRQVESPLDVLPLFARQGSILPLGPAGAPCSLEISLA